MLLRQRISRALCILLGAMLFVTACIHRLCAQSTSDGELPDAPQPRLNNQELVARLALPGDAANPESSSQKQPPEQNVGQQPENPHALAQQQLKEEEKQRVAGVLPSFSTSYRFDAVPLTAAQKFQLGFRTLIDPATFATALLTGGYREINDGESGFEWGAEGYWERAGAGYLDAFDSTMIGNALLPTLLHQDPRYFRLGHGSVLHRVLYASATSFIARGDKTRRWQPNYSNVMGNVIAGEISNFYYPSGDISNWEVTLTTALIQTVEGSLGAAFQEFWPDLSRRYLHKDPTHGLDAAQEKQKEEEPLRNRPQ